MASAYDIRLHLEFRVPGRLGTKKSWWRCYIYYSSTVVCVLFPVLFCFNSPLDIEKQRQKVLITMTGNWKMR